MRSNFLSANLAQSGGCRGVVASKTGLGPRLRSVRAILWAYAWGVITPAFCTSINWPLREMLAPASLLMIYFVGVVAVAMRYGRWPSTITAVLSAAAFAFFFAPPIFSLAMKDLENVLALGVMLLVAHVTSSSLERMRTQARIARQQEQRTAALYRLSEALSGAQTSDKVAEVTACHFMTVQNARAVLLLPDQRGHLEFHNYGVTENLPEFVDLSSAQTTFENSRSGSTPEKSSNGLFPLTGSAGPLGVLVLEPIYWRDLSDREEHAFIGLYQTQIAQSLERIQLAVQARKASIQAETETLRNALLSAISHDLRTPLTRIVGMASALAKQDGSLAPEERREFTQVIEDEAQHMADLMSKVLNMARLASGRIALHLEWHALEEIVGATLTRMESLMRGRDVSICLPDDLPLVHIDAVLIQQVLINLIENAVKYTPAGTPIDVSAEWNPQALRLEVADQGPGIPEELHERVFEKFYRVVPESPQSGAGLGLALCRAIVAAHGGEIAVRDRSGGGTVFSLTLSLHGQPPELNWHEAPDVAS